MKIWICGQALTNVTSKSQVSYFALDLGSLCRDLGFGQEILGSFSAIQFYDSSLHMGNRGT